MAMPRLSKKWLDASPISNATSPDKSYARSAAGGSRRGRDGRQSSSESKESSIRGVNRISHKKQIPRRGPSPQPRFNGPGRHSEIGMDIGGLQGYFDRQISDSKDSADARSVSQGRSQGRENMRRIRGLGMRSQRSLHS